MFIKARDVLQNSTTQIWEQLQPGKYTLQFDNQEIIETNHKEIILNSYFWEFFRAYPEAPVLKEHHIQHVLKGKPYSSNTHVQMIQNIFWHVADCYQFLTPASRDHLIKMSYEITNTLYNDLSCRLSEYVTSLDILDFIEVVEYPAIKEAIDELTPTDESIQKCYDTILKQLNNAEDLKHNALAFATRAKIVNANQVMQCVGPRGKITEVDGEIMPIPILRSFTKGLRTTYNMALESMTAAKSLYFSETPLQDGEYFARRLQLITMAVEYVERHQLVNGQVLPTSRHDCGSTDYLLWRVRGPESINGHVTYKGDLEYIAGKFYMDEETHTLKRIHKNDEHLINKTLKLRTVLGCQHDDPHGVCYTCFGGLADNIPEHANLGHVCSATVTQKITQSILSTKHLISSVVAGNIVLSELAGRFFKVGKKGDSLYISTAWKNKPIQMAISSIEAYGLTDITLVNEINDINPTRVSAIEFVDMVINHPNRSERHPIPVSYENRKAVLSAEFLQYLKTHGWEVDGNGNFLIEFSYWDFTKPVFIIPLKEYSYANHGREIAKIIESRITDISNREKPDSPKVTLVELFELVNSKLSVNIACLEVIIYAMMCSNDENNRFSMARGFKHPGLGVLGPVMRGRSLSNAYAYQDQATLIMSPESFFNPGREDNVLDVFMRPKEVVERYKPLKR